MNAVPIPARIEGDVVTMSRGDFERLIGMLEDAQDAVTAETVRQKLALGQEETVPSAFVDRMLAGESLIRLWREHRGLSQGVLSQQAGVSLSELMQIEDGACEADIRALKSIAKVLGLGLDDLVK